MKTRLILGALALTLSTSAFAADVTGKWTAQVPGRDGQTRETTFNFTAAGEKLTGTVSGRNGDNPIADGVVKGDDLSFSVSVNFGGNDMKLLYKGKVAGRGDQVHEDEGRRRPARAGVHGQAGQVGRVRGTLPGRSVGRRDQGAERCSVRGRITS